ncbi:3-hydroxyacyl-CoA dehydrogenase NAD-binding domain-containing protein [uncultured Martelella sp.]|uniref:3-hydroxyacyl-CoA dehydrogenase NAD-binding domain-containing protein n=1 Tax=uncultured Martelella sp. TaxID=392331 RepID=UPI0029C65CEB|nr:3-hydroxyacyl-CoA dehydrogenase NAD-binding domain-containing protein [uncultured Martelella sp.]
MTAIETTATIGVIGAGTMGAGIAQLAAAAGHPVLLFDAKEGAAATGRERMVAGLKKLIARGKIDAAKADAIIDRVQPVATMEALAPAALVVEAIVEDLDIKRKLFAALEDVVAPEAILATNTSSISVTAIARDLKQPGRFVGMHFFNPAVIMKLVEVISGVATSKEVAETVFATAENWGKIAVHAKSTPGFIVNRVARGFYAEALRLYEEQVADPATLDAIMTGAGGFRMGPFELMDLIGHDVNYAVSLSVFTAYYQEPRFRPALSQLELVNAGRLGRKSGQGFYGYAEGSEKPEPASETASPDAAPIEGLAPGIETEIDGVALKLTDGRTAREVAAETGRPVIICDLARDGASRMAFAVSPDVPENVVARVVATLAAQGIAATRLPDWPGLVLMRTLAVIANEGFEAVMQGVSDEAGVDTAMRYGVNYPKGPIGWAREVGLARIVAVLDNLHRLTGDPRYRASLRLRMALQD